MGEVSPMPGLGDVFADVRGGDRTMWVSFHRQRAVVVVSLWTGSLCRGSFRVDGGDLDRLIAILNEARIELRGPSAGSGPHTEEMAVTGAAEAEPPQVEKTGDITGGTAVNLIPANPVPAPLSLRVA